MSDIDFNNNILPKVNFILGSLGFLLSIILFIRSCNQDIKIEEFNKGEKKPVLSIEDVQIDYSHRTDSTYMNKNKKWFTIVPITFTLKNQSANNIIVNLESYCSTLLYDDTTNYLNFVFDEENLKRFYKSQMPTFTQREIKPNQSIQLEGELEYIHTKYDGDETLVFNSLFFINNQFDYQYCLYFRNKINIITVSLYDTLNRSAKNIIAINIDTLNSQSVVKLSEEQISKYEEYFKNDN